MQVKDIESNSVEISLCSNWVCRKLQTVLHAVSAWRHSHMCPRHVVSSDNSSIDDKQ